jgi:methionine-rich copper-binding protein CopC
VGGEAFPAEHVPVDGEVMGPECAADLAAGGYVLRWQVLAIDGHITRGDIPFAVGN